MTYTPTCRIWAHALISQGGTLQLVTKCLLLFAMFSLQQRDTALPIRYLMLYTVGILQGAVTRKRIL